MANICLQVYLGYLFYCFSIWGMA